MLAPWASSNPRKVCSASDRKRSLITARYRSTTLMMARLS